jgi:hypothetical protein
MSHDEINLPSNYIYFLHFYQRLSIGLTAASHANFHGNAATTFAYLCPS